VLSFQKKKIFNFFLIVQKKEKLPLDIHTSQQAQ